jgi:mRNA interferase RelE/StbE
VYKIVFTTQAAKSFQRMPRKTANSIREKLTQIANDLFASVPNATKLQGRAGYRLRVGDWRVIYEIDKTEVVIIVLKIAPRGEVYR